MRLLFTSIFFLFLIFPASSQELIEEPQEGEMLLNLEVNPQLLGKKNKSHYHSQLKSEDDSSKLIIVIDTLKLPFVDDFSVNRLKKYDMNNVVSVPRLKFTVNGIYKDSVEGVHYVTYLYIYDMATHQLDSFPTQPKVINFYDYYDTLSTVLLLTGTDTLWQDYSYHFDSASMSIDSFPRDTIYYNARDTFLLLPDDGFSLWVDSNAYINNNYGVNPPTIGVATFDGVNSEGMPYDFTSPTTYGIADYLTSKPIDLTYLPSDSLLLSFFYQPQGLGDDPQSQDSLVLEFFSPVDSSWNWAWSAKGSLLQSFQKVKIQITDTMFLKKGFRMRFKNYATLSGLLDHWNIDYIYLDKGRAINDNAVNDFGFVSIGNSFVKNYTSIPWKHYKTDTMQTIDFYPVKMTNLSDLIVYNDHNQFYVYDEPGVTLYETSDPGSNAQPFFPALSQVSFNHTVNISPGNNFRFPVDNNNKKTFKIKLVAEQTTITDTIEIDHYNDSTFHYQVFDSYYAYDDGSAEKTYALVGLGAKLAYKFTTLQTDTLRGVYFYFPYMLNDVKPFTFRIVIWADNNGQPGNVIYQTTLENPNYTNEINEFLRYSIDTTLILSGTFYVGWQQTTADRIYVGFDYNINSQSKIFYNVSGAWNNTQFTGSLMIRPDFGYPSPAAHVGVLVKKEYKFGIYPNPANQKINLQLSENNLPENEIYNLAFYNILGELVFQISNIRFQTSNEIDVSNLPNGMYFLKIEDAQNNFSSVKKLLISR